MSERLIGSIRREKLACSTRCLASCPEAYASYNQSPNTFLDWTRMLLTGPHRINTNSLAGTPSSIRVAEVRAVASGIAGHQMLLS